MAKYKHFFFGFSYWKHNFIKAFFPDIKESMCFCTSLQQALKKGLSKESSIYIWGKKPFEKVESYASKNHLPIYRVEDGFIRSVSLGSDLSRPYSLVIDSRGIYFDPTAPSDLEHILNTCTFDKELLLRAQKLRQILTSRRLSKYNSQKDQPIRFHTSKKIILVVGQVEDDASIIYGGNKMSNLELLKKVYKKRKGEYIVYKPHPDVLTGNRRGNIPKNEALKYVDKVIENISLHSLLDICDELHTITSLSGFEALLRKKTVYTYGLPFYAGWGLSNDERKSPNRHQRRSIDELVAATLILYPRYIDPISKQICDVEKTIQGIDTLKQKYHQSFWYRNSIKIKDLMMRYGQFIVKRVLRYE